MYHSHQTIRPLIPPPPSHRRKASRRANMRVVSCLLLSLPCAAGFLAAPSSRVALSSPLLAASPPQVHVRSRAPMAKARTASRSTALFTASLGEQKEFESPSVSENFMVAYEKASTIFTNLFPVWLTLFSAVALKDPKAFAW